MRSLYLIFLFLFLTPFLGVRAEITIPSLNSPVIDHAKLLNNHEKNYLDQRIRAILSKNGPQVQIYTIESLEGENIEELSYRAFTKWQLGDKEKDNGLLLIVAKKERELRIEVGSGIEGELTDAQSKLIILNLITPEFKKARFYAGFSNFLSEIETIFLNQELSPQTTMPAKQFRPVRRRPLKYSISPIAFLFFILLPFVALVRRKSVPFATISSAMMYSGLGVLIFGFTLHNIIIYGIIGFLVGLLGPTNLLLLFLASSMRSRRGGFGGGGFGGGGGWSGGGGGFSGGGSSGSW